MTAYYSFNKEIADSYGLSAAILLQYIHYWCRRNEAEGRNEVDGTYWTYNTIPAILEQIPCLSEWKIKDATKKLVKAGLIVVGNFNRTKADKMKWYAVTDIAKAILDPCEEAEEMVENAKSEETVKCEKVNSGAGFRAQTPMKNQKPPMESKKPLSKSGNSLSISGNHLISSNTIYNNNIYNIKTTNKDINISSPISSPTPSAGSSPTPAAKSRADEKKPTQGNCPFFEILRAYHALCPSYPQITIISGDRRQAVLKAWRQYGDLSFFTRMFEQAEASDYLKGENDRGWSADFDWMFKAGNFGKILEGRYAHVYRREHKRENNVSDAVKRERDENRTFDPNTIFERALARSYSKMREERHG